MGVGVRLLPLARCGCGCGVAVGLGLTVGGVGVQGRGEWGGGDMFASLMISLNLKSPCYLEEFFYNPAPFPPGTKERLQG